MKKKDPYAHHGRNQTPQRPGGAAPANPPSVSAPAAPSVRTRRKDQERALTAYAWAEAAKTAGLLEKYEIAVQGFAAALLRSGFAAAVSVAERNAGHGGYKQLLDNLASYSLPGLPVAAAAEWPGKVRGELKDVGLYMQATRELIALLAWLRRACRALGEKTP